MKSPAMARNPATRPSSSTTQTSWRTSTTSRKYSRSSSAVWPFRAWRSGKARRRERRQRSFTASKSGGSYRRISGPRAIREIYIGYERERSTIFAYPRGLLVATASSVALLVPSSGGRAPQCPGPGASRPRLRAPYQIDQLRSAADTGEASSRDRRRASDRRRLGQCAARPPARAPARGGEGAPTGERAEKPSPRRSCQDRRRRPTVPRPPRPALPSRRSPGASAATARPRAP